MKSLWLCLLLLTSVSSAEENKSSGLTEENIHDLGLILSPAETEKQQLAMQISQEWHTGLNKFLAETEDTYLLSLALYRMVSEDSFSQGMRTIKGQEKKPSNLPAEQIANLINSLIKSATQLKPETMTLLGYACFYPALLPHCDKPLLINARIKHDPHNLISYLRPLTLSVQENDEKKILTILNLMTQAAYSDNHFYLLNSFQDAINRYEDSNPMPQEMVDNNLAFYEKLKSPNEEAKASRQKHMREELLYLVEVSTRMSFHLPNFVFLKEFCKENSEYQKQCIQVADILIEKSRDDISTVVGYQIKLAVLETQNNQEATITLQTQYQEYKNQRQCLLDYISDHRFDDVLKGIELDRIAYDPSRTEFNNFIKQTQFIYHQRKGNESIKDPAYCLSE